MSGVGKTQILKAIFDLKRIANGESLDGVAWDIIFQVDENEHEYHWQGEFATTGTGDIDKFLDEKYKAKHPSKIMQEYLSLNDTEIIKRNQTETVFNGSKLPIKLLAAQSAIKSLSENESVMPIQANFNKILRSDLIAMFPEMLASLFSTQFYSLLIQYRTLESIRNSDLSIYFRLALAYKNAPDVFEKIKQHFIGMFPQVVDVKLDFLNRKNLQPHFARFPFLQLKERGIKSWIKEISDGMFKSFLLIGDVYLCSAGTVILMDEFENSLGVNCIDIFENIPYESYDLQFIITSHHPYIINNVPMLDWKIVTRKGSVVTVKDASQFNLGKSKHTAFNQLLQLDEFNEGIILP